MRFSSLLSAILLISYSSVLVEAGSQSVKPDPRVRIVSPIPGAVFAPGDRVSVELAADSSLQPDLCDVSVSGSGLGLVDCATEILHFPLHCSGVIPEGFAGPVTLTALFDRCRSERSEESYSEPYSSEPVTIGVRPQEPPERLSMINPSLHITLAKGVKVAEERVAVRGIYAGGLERDLRSSISGTTYRSTDPSVAAVDPEGVLSPLRPGVAIVIAENRGAKDFMIVRITTDDQPWLPPDDVTAAFRIELGEISPNKRHDHPSIDFVNFIQDIRVTNSSELPVPGPLYFVLANLPTDVSLYEQGVTRYVAPLGTPVVEIPLPTIGLSLNPQEPVVLHLDFSFRSRTATRESIRYTPRIFRADREP